MAKYNYAYVIIERTSNKCIQTLKTNNANFSVDNELHYSMLVDMENISAMLGKYYYNNQWVERVWSEVDEYGQPVENATYTDIVCAFKSLSARMCKSISPIEKVFQNSFHDHIIRGEKDYEKIWEYIEFNAQKWKDDCFYNED